MFTFDKIIIINGNKYDIITDETVNVLQLFKNIVCVDFHIILVISSGSNKYTIDLSELVVAHIEIAGSTVRVLIDSLTPELIYSFSTSMFQQHKIVRSFMSHDLPGEVSVSPYNIEIDETTNTIYDPSYRDMVISCNKYDLINVVPIIDNKLRKCGWGGKKIYLKDRVELTPFADIISFLSFGETSIKIHNLREALSMTLDKMKSYILVLNGRMFYDVPYIYKVDKNRGRLDINQLFTMELFLEFENYDTLIDDPDSFIIEVNNERIFVRNVMMVPINNEDGVSVFKYHEADVQNNHVDYVCIDNKESTVHGITTIDEQYKNIALNKNPHEHHVYVHDGSNDMRLLQLALY